MLGGAFSGSTEGTSSGTVWLVLGVIMGIGWFLVVGARSIEWLMRDRESLAESLTHHVWDGFAEEIGRRRAEARDHVPAGSADGAALPPAPQPFGVSDAGAEALVCTWMQHLGQADAEVTRFSGDGGIDVGSTHYVAQVKNYAGTVGVTAIRELFGVATADGRRPLFFTSGGYTSEAESFAARIAMPLFTYNAAEGTVGGANVAAEDLLETGL